MHLKNYRLLPDRDVAETKRLVTIFLARLLILRESSEESALPLRGKKSGLTRNLLVGI